MEQVFFRLHVRFVSTVTRLLSPKTRRVLEYVTLANAFLLVVSLTWLHTRFVNPKGGQGSAVSCLPAALERAGVDPAQLHVLQIHIRLPPDDRGGGDGNGSGSGRRRHLPIVSSSDDSRSCTPAVDERSDYDARHPSDRTKEGDDDRDTTAPDGRDTAGSLGSDGEGSVEGGGGVGSGEEDALRNTLVADPASSGRVIGGDGSSPEFESPSPSPEIFYSMKLVTGKDAVGTLSGPVTLGIDKFVGKGARGKGDGAEEGGGGGGGGSGGGGGAGCGAMAEEKRLTIVQSLMEAFAWVKGEAAAMREGYAAVTGHCAAGSLAPGGQDTLDCQEHQRGAGMAAGGGEGDAGNDQRVQDEVYLYSLEKGFLMLRPDLRRKHGIVTANVTVSAHDSCMGGTVVQTLVKDFIGYDTVVMNWLISLYGGRGFLYGVHNNELFNLNYAAEFIESTEDIGKFLVFKIGVMFTTLFLFFTTTTLVSFTLRETQERMLKFTFLLQHHVRHRLPYAPLIFTHVVESLVFVPIMVGILFFLFEFFSDQLLAFMVLSVVWLCEVYSVVSVRTSVCIRFFPQVFFLYFTLFHVYFFSFPFGFSYLALVTTVLFLQHSMLFCWNRYEVPALTSGVISAARPRQAGMVIGVVPRYDPHGMGLPLMPQPGGGVGAGVTAGVAAAPGRQRAATASSLEEPREFITPAVRAVGRVIPRSNSSPDPTSSSHPFGGDRIVNSNSGRGDTPAAAAVAAVSAAAISAAPAASLSRGSGETVTAPAARRPEVEWPHPGGLSGEGGGGGGAGSGGGFVGNPEGGFVENPTSSGHISAPLLGSFPFSFWNRVQTQANDGREPTSASATTTTVAMDGPSASDGERNGRPRSRSGSAVALADAEAEGEGGDVRGDVPGGPASRGQETASGVSAGGEGLNGEGERDGGGEGVPQRGRVGAAALPSSVNAQTATAAAAAADAPASAVLGGDAEGVPAAMSVLDGFRKRRPAGTTNPPEPCCDDDAGGDLHAKLGGSQISPVDATAAARERGAGGPDQQGREQDQAGPEREGQPAGGVPGVSGVGRVAVSAEPLLPTRLLPVGMPPGPSDGAGQLFGGGGGGGGWGQERQWEQPGGESDVRRAEERGSLRGEEDDGSGRLPLSSGGTARRSLVEEGGGGGGLSGRASSPTGPAEGR